MFEVSSSSSWPGSVGGLSSSTDSPFTFRTKSTNNMDSQCKDSRISLARILSKNDFK